MSEITVFDNSTKPHDGWAVFSGKDANKILVWASSIDLISEDSENGGCLLFFAQSERVVWVKGEWPRVAHTLDEANKKSVP